MKKKIESAMTFQTKINIFNVDIWTKIIPFPLRFHILSFQPQPIVRRRLLRQRYR